ncbi:MAG TPA: DNA alkylation repair protein [Methanocorpusculum sp.]|nr:DNA alkylation repair protein [Methanocorpusculum sp.]
MKKDFLWGKELSNHAIRTELESLKEKSYKEFSSSLLPGTENIIGVRIPILRSIAKRLAQEDWKKSLLNLTDDTFEEILLQGLVIANAKDEPEEILNALEQFVVKISNWSICDSSAAALKIVKKYPGTFFAYAKECIDDGREFHVRFGLVLLLFHFVDGEHILAILQIVDDAILDGYYAKMAASWLISVCYVKYPDITETWMKSAHIDTWTFNKAIQKIRESRRVPDRDKERLSLLKRI